MKPRGDMGGAPHRVSSAPKFGNIRSCYLDDKGQPALEAYSTPPTPAHFRDQQPHAGVVLALLQYL